MDTNTLVISGSALVLVLLGLSAFAGIVSKASNKVAAGAKGSKSDLILFVSDTVLEVLEVLRETVIAELKEKSADGQLTSDEIENIIILAKRRIGVILSDSLHEELSDIIGNVDEWIDTKVRAIVLQFKKI